MRHEKYFPVLVRDQSTQSFPTVESPEKKSLLS